MIWKSALSLHALVCALIHAWFEMYHFILCRTTAEASLVTQSVQNPPAMWETWVPSLGRDAFPGEEYEVPDTRLGEVSSALQ